MRAEWLNHFPWERVDYPLLFDRNAQPKPAFEAYSRPRNNLASPFRYWYSISTLRSAFPSETGS